MSLVQASLLQVQAATNQVRRREAVASVGSSGCPSLQTRPDERDPCEDSTGAGRGDLRDISVPAIFRVLGAVCLPRAQFLQ